MIGGAKSELTTKLSKIFSERLTERAGEIFSKKIKKTNKLEDYVRSCNLNDDINKKITRRQPYILNAEELKDINPESYSGEPLEYTTNGNKNYYICPKYFNTKTKKPMSLKEIKDNNLEDFINRSKKELDPNKYIIEMDMHNYAGFLKSGDKNKGTLKSTKNEDELCVPCCFISQSTDTQEALKSLCKEDDKTLIKELTQNVVEKYDYILSEETNPLPKNNIGKLQQVIQKLLNINYRELNIIGNVIPMNTTSLVRIGIEKNKNEDSTFLSCMLELFNRRNNNQKLEEDKIKNVNEFKKYITDRMTIDQFVRYNNGNLVNIFYDSERDFDIPEIKSNFVIKDILKNNKKQYSKLINAFTKFKEYINDDKFDEDYKYLYNIFTDKNKYIYREGINIIILDVIEKKDETGKLNYHVELICPPNTSTNDNIFESLNDSVILIKYNNNYEPLCEYSFIDTNINKAKTKKEKF